MTHTTSNPSALDALIEAAEKYRLYRFVNPVEALNKIHSSRAELAALREQNRELREARSGNRPRLVCICGSSRFVDYSAVKAWELNKQGIATFFMPLLPQWYPNVQEHHQAEAESVAAALDQLWLQLIEMADSILVVNINGYIGERTAIEIKHAESLGKPIEYTQALAAERKDTP